MLCAALASTPSTLLGALKSNDTLVMLRALKQLGVNIAEEWSENRIVIQGAGGDFPILRATLEVENSGTTIRFLTAALAFAGGQYRLQGVDRMHQRPIGALVDALNNLGANVSALSPGGCPPVVIASDRIIGGTTQIKGSVSSQYLSGLIMASPLAEKQVVIELDGPLVSRPYIEMTCQVMERFGVSPLINDAFTRFEMSPDQHYCGTPIAIEPDATAASYFWATAAICGGSATVNGLGSNTLQGDVKFVNCLQRMGCQISLQKNCITVTGPATHGIDVDMSDISDTVQTLAAVALFVDGTTTIRGVAHNRVKETDRIGNLAIELRKFGAAVDEHADGLSVTPGTLKPATIQTYDDHRMAMSLALVGLKLPGVILMDPGCVAKTYPNFFADLDSVYVSNR